MNPIKTLTIEAKELNPKICGIQGCSPGGGVWGAKPTTKINVYFSQIDKKKFDKKKSKFQKVIQNKKTQPVVVTSESINRT